MANYETLIATIQQAIKENHNNEITGPILQAALLSIINSLGAGYQFIGIATPTTNPGTPDQKVAYLAGPGTYVNFDGIVVETNEFCIIKGSGGTWQKEITGAASVDALGLAESNIIEQLYNYYPKATDFTTSKELDSHGGIISSGANYRATESYFRLSQGATTTIICKAYQAIPVVCIYDKNKNFIRAIYPTSGNYETHTFIVGVNEYFARFSFYASPGYTIFDNSFLDYFRDKDDVKEITYIQAGSLNYSTNPNAVMICTLIPFGKHNKIIINTNRPVANNCIYRYLVYYYINEISENPERIVVDNGHLSDYVRETRQFENAILKSGNETCVAIVIQQYNTVTNETTALTPADFVGYNINFIWADETGDGGQTIESKLLDLTNQVKYNKKEIEIKKINGFYVAETLELYDSTYYKHSQPIELAKGECLYITAIRSDLSVAALVIQKTIGSTVTIEFPYIYGETTLKEFSYIAKEDCSVIISFKPETLGRGYIISPSNPDYKFIRNQKIIGCVWFDGWGSTRLSWIEDIGWDSPIAQYEINAWQTEHPELAQQYPYWWDWAAVQEGYVIPRQVSYDMYFAKRGIDNKPIRGWRYSNVDDFDDDIKLAHNVGLDYFCCCWYPRFDENGNLDEAETESIYANAWVNWANESKNLMGSNVKLAAYVTASATTENQVKSILDYLNKRLFSKKFALMIDNKPVIFIKSDSQNGYWLNRESLREHAESYHFVDYYLIGDNFGYNQNVLDDVWNYSETGSRFGLSGTNEYSLFSEKIVDFAKKQYPQIPTVSLGFDRRNQDDTNTPSLDYVYLNYSNDEFYNQLKGVAETLDARNNNKIISIYAWNELGEGGWLLPTQDDPNGTRLATLKAFIDNWKNGGHRI